MNLPGKMDVHGRRITDNDVRRGIRTSILASCLGVSWFAMTQNMPLQMFMEALGARGVLIGLLQTSMQLALIAQLPGALLARSLVARKKTWAAFSLGSRLLWFLPLAFLGLAREHPHGIAVATVVLVAVSNFMNQSVTAFWFSWIADLVPERIRGYFWGMRQSWVMTAFLITMGVAGLVLDGFPNPSEPGGSWMGFGLVFFIGAVMGCLDIVIHLAVPEPVIRLPKDMAPWTQRILSPLRNKDFRRLTVAMGIYMFSLGLISLGVVYLKKDFGATYSQLAAVAIAGSVGTVVSGFAWGYVLDRIGGRAFGVVMVLLAPLIMFCWFFVRDESADIVGFLRGVWVLGPAVEAAVNALPAGWAAAIRGCVLPQPIWILLLANFGSGVIFGGINLSQLNLSAALLPEKGRTMAMAVHWSTVGLIGAMGSMIGGAVMDLFAAHPVDVTFPTGTKLAFHQPLVVLHMVIMWAVVLPLLLGVRRGKGDLAVGQAFARILTTNPIRAVPNIYLLTSAVARHRKALAVHRLGEQRTALAAVDLIEKLEDPSPDVREESALALGSIASSEAIEALNRKLEDPLCDLAPQVARALRLARDPRCVDVLIRRLQSDTDRETRVECARALGAIGDARATAVVTEVLTATTDTKIMAACAEALARLDKVFSVRDILPRMKAARHPVLRRSLAVAVGDLLGEADGFYKLLTREQHTRGSEFADMLKDLRSGIRDVAHELKREGEGRELVVKARALGAAFDENKHGVALDLLFELAVGAADLVKGVKFGGNVEAFVSELVLRDAKFGLGVWSLDVMRQGDSPDVEPDGLEVLLGLYFLSFHLER